MRLEQVLAASRLGDRELLQLETTWPTLGDEIVELGQLCMGQPAKYHTENIDYVGAQLQEAGHTVSQMIDVLDEAKAGPNGRPRTRQSIEALELRLKGKSYREIVDHQDRRQTGDDDAVRKDRIKKRIKEVMPLYEKYLPRK